MTELMDIVPSLAPGVVVHVHDIFLPKHYTRSQYAFEGRMYTEQYVLQAFLAFNSEFTTEYAASWLWEAAGKEEVTRAFRWTFPAGKASVEELGSPDSFWMRRHPP